MKTRANQALRELRRIIDQTQAEFAAMIGASKDAVVSWELGRNQLSRPFVRRIALATGVEEGALVRGRGPLLYVSPLRGRQAYTAESFEAHRESYWGRTEEGAARQHLRNCADALGLLFLAAAQPGRGKDRYRLPALVDSFVLWCERTREEFELGPEIEQLLERRKTKLVIQHTYGEWRRMQKEDPAACRLMGFKDNPKKSDQESLRLEAETVPVWRPGHPMRAGLG